jgi:hypothetical protein
MRMMLKLMQMQVKMLMLTTRNLPVIPSYEGPMK